MTTKPPSIDRRDAIIIRANKETVRSGIQAAVRICIHDGICTRRAVVRGLCRSHAQELYRVIRQSNGRITLEMMERSGRCLPLKRPAKMWFYEGFEGLGIT